MSSQDPDGDQAQPDEPLADKAADAAGLLEGDGRATLAAKRRSLAKNTASGGCGKRPHNEASDFRDDDAVGSKKKERTAGHDDLDPSIKDNHEAAQDAPSEPASTAQNNVDDSNNGRGSGTSFENPLLGLINLQQIKNRLRQSSEKEQIALGFTRRVRNSEKERLSALPWATAFLPPKGEPEETTITATCEWVCGSVTAEAVPEAARADLVTRNKIRALGLLSDALGLLSDRNGAALNNSNTTPCGKPKDEMTRQREMSGRCGSCGIKTHKTTFWKRQIAITNDNVFQGSCIRCNHFNLPAAVVQQWERQNPLDGVVCAMACGYAEHPLEHNARKKHPVIPVAFAVPAEEVETTSLPTIRVMADPDTARSTNTLGPRSQLGAGARDSSPPRHATRSDGNTLSQASTVSLGSNSSSPWYKFPLNNMLPTMFPYHMSSGASYGGHISSACTSRSISSVPSLSSQTRSKRSSSSKNIPGASSVLIQSVPSEPPTETIHGDAPGSDCERGVETQSNTPDSSSVKEPSETKTP
jgi:hypothetical protein